MSKPPAAIVEQLQSFLAQVRVEEVAMYEVAAAAFLVREQAYWTLLARDPHLMESRFAQFLACPSTYALVEGLIDEDAPAMSAGAGGVAGIGIGPQGEPGVKLPRKRRVDEAAKGPDETFAGADVFNVPTDKFMNSRFGKNRYHQYARYVGKDAVGESIRQHGRSSRKRDIVLKDQATGAMVWLLRRKKAA
jgi:hypothetical protein